MSHYGYIGAPEDEPGYWDNHGPEDEPRSDDECEEEAALKTITIKSASDKPWTLVRLNYEWPGYHFDTYQAAVLTSLIAELLRMAR